MKRLPIYALLIGGYIIILSGVRKLYINLSYIEEINIPASQDTVTKIDIVPLIIISVFGVIIAVSIGVYLLTELWKYFVAHKTLLPIPFLGIGLAFLNLAIKIMQGVSIMIQANSDTFIDSLNDYITAFNQLSTYTLIGIACVGLSVVYSALLKRGIIFP
jgi:hypothetical protein